MRGSFFAVRRTCWSQVPVSKSRQWAAVRSPLSRPHLLLFFFRTCVLVSKLELLLICWYPDSVLWMGLKLYSCFNESKVWFFFSIYIRNLTVHSREALFMVSFTVSERASARHSEGQEGTSNAS